MLLLFIFVLYLLGPEPGAVSNLDMRATIKLHPQTVYLETGPPAIAQAGSEFTLSPRQVFNVQFYCFDLMNYSCVTPDPPLALRLVFVS